MDEGCRDLVERLFDGFNRRDSEEIVAVCDERMEFFAVTAEQVGRAEPYRGVEGLQAYLRDVSSVWEELLITPTDVEQQGGRLLVKGRVYLRSRALGIRDMPTAWIWELENGLFVRGRVFVDPEEGVRAFSREAGRGPLRDPDEQKSMTRLR